MSRSPFPILLAPDALISRRVCNRCDERSGAATDARVVTARVASVFLVWYVYRLLSGSIVPKPSRGMDGEDGKDGKDGDDDDDDEDDEVDEVEWIRSIKKPMRAEVRTGGRSKRERDSNTRDVKDGGQMDDELTPKKRAHPGP